MDYSTSDLVKKYCCNCYKEGSYECSLVVEDDKCVNFVQYDKLNHKTCFGGY